MLEMSLLACHTAVTFLSTHESLLYLTASGTGYSHVLPHMIAEAMWCVQMERRRCGTITACSAMTGQLDCP